MIERKEKFRLTCDCKKQIEVECYVNLYQGHRTYDLEVLQQIKNNLPNKWRLIFKYYINGIEGKIKCPDCYPKYKREPGEELKLVK